MAEEIIMTIQDQLNIHESLYNAQVLLGNSCTVGKLQVYHTPSIQASHQNDNASPSSSIWQQETITVFKNSQLIISLHSSDKARPNNFGKKIA